MMRTYLVAVSIFALMVLAGCGSDSPTDSGSGGGGDGGDGDELEVSITNPGDGASFLQGFEIEFQGSAQDLEENPLTGEDLVWTSDRDGALGTGKNLDTYELSVNTHVITLTATDSENHTGSESITVTVEATDGLVPVPATAGFPMGWNEHITGHEEPEHSVSLSAFRIGEYEVTYVLWSEVKAYADAHGYVMNDANMGDNINTTPAHPATYMRWKDCLAWCNAYSQMKGLTPVYYTDETHANIYKEASQGMDGYIGNDCVDWSADGFRLPTEAEWEYAARYIDGSTFVAGDEHVGFDIDPDVDDCAWFRANSNGSSMPVGQLQPNALGVYDMSGNGAEWCWDWYQADYYDESPTNNPRGPDPETGVYKIYRGGAYNNDGTSMYGYVCYRFAWFPFEVNSSRTFRVCRSGSGE